jgi:hypothetical protein
MTRTFRAVAVLVFGLAPAAAMAQSLGFGTASGPSSRTVRSGEDFATTVIGDSWDMSNRDDFVHMFSNGWASGPSLSNSVVSGVGGTNPTVQIQFEGILGALNSVGRNGWVFPIDANRYTRISFRMRRNRPPHDFDLLQVFWFFDTIRTASTVGSKLGLSNDFDDSLGRYVSQSPPASQDGTGYQIYKLDLPGTVFNRSVGQPYGGTARGIALGLGGGAFAPDNMSGAVIDLDWVRLTQQGAGTTQRLAWSGFSGRVTLRATNGSDTIQIFPDNGTRDVDFPSAGSFDWDYGFLPPGTWTVTAAGATGGSDSIALVVDAAPVLTFTEPDAGGGRDFARSVIGDAWDMTNPEDVQRYGAQYPPYARGLYEITGPIFAENGLTATTVGHDPSVELFDDSDKAPGRELRVDATTYRHLTFTVDYDHKELDAATALSGTFGGVLRLAWRRADANGHPLTVTQDIFVLDGGPHTYSVDLATLDKICTDFTAVPDCELEGGFGADLWTGTMTLFRIDPYEPATPRTFRLADVTLAADDEPNGNGFFLVTWNASDASFAAAPPGGGAPAAANATVDLRYDLDRNAANGFAGAIADDVAATAGQFAWDVSGVPPGRYYIFASISDASGNTQGIYSGGIVRTSGASFSRTDSDGDGMPNFFEAQYGVSSAAGDNDGDTMSNVAEYQAGTDPTLANTVQLPEGATGFFTERIAVVNPGLDQADFTVSYLREGGAPIVRDYTAAARSRLTIEVNDVAGLSSAAVSAVVNVTRGGVAVERTMIWDARDGSNYGGHTGKAVQQPRTQWYLAEGDAGFFDTYILFANSNGSPASVTATFLLTNGSTIVSNYMVAANTRLTVYANDVPGLRGQAFSTTIGSNIPITVERAMYFSTGGRFWNGGHESAAVAAPATTWFVAEGRTGPFFDTWLLLANPGGSPVTATITYLLPGGSTIVEARSLPATSRTTINVDSVPGLADTDVSASISATGPIIVERAMYWPDPFTSWYEAHNSAGVTQTGTKWVLAEGEQGGTLGWDTYILVANPNAAAAAVRMTVLRGNGLPPRTVDMTVGANSRLTRTIGEAEFGITPGERFGVLVESLNGVPVVVERAMYWNALGQFWGGGTNETATRMH